MKTLTVEFGAQEYPAAKLTITEFGEVTKAISDMQTAARSDNLTEVNRLVLVLAEIVCASVRRAGSNITLRNIEGIATPEEIVQALGTLMHLERFVDLETIATAVN